MEAPSTQFQTQNVILITLDGVRTQEMFGGLDASLVKEYYPSDPLEETKIYK
jgi:hypothetical protein